jgi:RHH-type transcriptional regulator, proline utilization regulon repressor / proline dehydrogenase / delta 1-pyrroline-5-carboxylate dehydrogenase
MVVPRLIEQARLSPAIQEKSTRLATRLVESLRAHAKSAGVEGLIQEYSLSSQEGVALMCLAEALLRIPDRDTRDALIRDKISRGNWRAHLGHAPSVFVNAATWGLLVTGKLVAVDSETTLASVLTRLISRGSEPLIRKGVDLAMRLMGEQFVAGQTIAKALVNSRQHEANGFRYSYDMLGEAATTAEDAESYFQSYEQAIRAIGAASAGRGIYEGPGISIKLSALHPRYSRGQYQRVINELLPRLRSLTLLARQYDIGINIDAEEADRLEISLDLLEALCFDPDLKDWNGIGFVVQAYQKRCPLVIDFIIDLAQRSGHRIMVRLVKGAYWDTEIKRAQVDGLEGYPVYTRKIYTDISYLACARKLLAAAGAVYPQFATHNALTLAAIYHLAGSNYYAGQYEFQCLHGMGEALYAQVVGRGRLDRPCRIYAPVGTHETLLAYLVRRLLENGANTSFVNRIADRGVAVAELVSDPILEAEKIIPLGAPHDKIPLPAELYGATRKNSTGIDLSSEQVLHCLGDGLTKSAKISWSAKPMLGIEAVKSPSKLLETLVNPANRDDAVGLVTQATDKDVELALTLSCNAFEHWSNVATSQRARYLKRAADLLEEEMPRLMGLIIREAGKSISSAVAEIREAVDFLRYYAHQVERDFTPDTHRPLGPVVCISPWNFPLAIFVGQVAAALAAGNTVIAKPAEQTPLIAAQAVGLLWAAGIPHAALQLLPGDGATVGAALVGDARVRAVMFTGSTDVAQLINRTLSRRLAPDGQPIPFIAETGGQNAMIVDSSALAEQVVVDVLHSAFDSAGQRCSALRVLCLQEDVADRTLDMLLGAMRELKTGNPHCLSTDVGPVIDAQARTRLESHISEMRANGHAVTQLPLSSACDAGTFVPPTIIEIASFSEVKTEVFGPVLHVMRYTRHGLKQLMQSIRASGYGLTLGVHTRIEETVNFVVDQARVGNIYVNRNVVGAVVGVQPFGGEGLSGTGPKAGGALYLRRLLSVRPQAYPSLFDDAVASGKNQGLADLRDHFAEICDEQNTTRCQQLLHRPVGNITITLDGPTGERNTYSLTSRGTVLCVAQSVGGAHAQLLAAIAAGNKVLLAGSAAEEVYQSLPLTLRAHVVRGNADNPEINAALHEGDARDLLALLDSLAGRDGPIVPVQSLKNPATTSHGYVFDQLVAERTVSVNTTAAGGNANLMTLT